MGCAVRLVRLAGPALFLGGLAALAVGFLQGEATLSLFVVFPVVTATGVWSILGIVFMVAGVFVFFLTGSIPDTSPVAPGPVPPPAGTPPAAPQRRWGGVVFLGPIPVVFGSDERIARWMLVLGVLLFVALLVLTVIALRGI
ncbi:MAG TPA: DUF131 domain-containing protein [Thermoplasmata archaeon]|nr:DUF131 domain-containing protein [Thermoplasmata archaeon]